MKHESKWQSMELADRQEGARTCAPADRKPFRRRAGALAVSVLCAVAAGCDGSAMDEALGEEYTAGDPDDGAAGLRRFIDRQVGGIEKLTVPAEDSELPQPLLDDGTPDPRFRTTEAKRYLGKQLYFDPVRTARILPEFGGVLATRQTGSCGSCHLGEVAGKGGTLINLGVGGEGRGFTDARGDFVPRRRIQPGLVDTVPTLTEICANSVGLTCSQGDVLLQSGAADAVDSVPRNVPTMIGFAFNTRLLQGGLAGGPVATNPNGLPAGENLTEDTIAVHRMVQFQAAELQRIPVYVKLFTEAFPEEAAAAGAQGDIDLLINDETVFRAMATFLRTVVTRNTPWDRFLAGDDRALTAAQQRGARLFFTAASRGERDGSGRDGRRSGGAGCFTCHSGPMLNKQLGDEAGVLVEENFFNLGLADHPLQALNADVLGDPGHRDRGRMDVTGLEEDEFEFRVLSLRQLEDGLLFMHNGSFTSVKDVVEYFNAGVPQDAEAAAAGTLTTRFTSPRGPGAPPGLGLDGDEIDDLTDFLENALADPAFAAHDPDSTTRTFELNEQDVTYSVFRPDLAELGAIDGRTASGLPRSNNDALSRRDVGIEFLDVTAQVETVLVESRTSGGGRSQEDVYRITNDSSSIVDTHLLMVAQGLPDGIRLENGSGTSSAGDPFRRVFLRDGVLAPGQSIVKSLVFARDRSAPQVSYTLTLLSGQGTP